MATNVGKIRLRRGSTDDWGTDSPSPTLFEGQPGIEYRSGKTPRIKVGPLDNAEPPTGTSWSNCSYIAPDADIYTDTQIVNSNGHTVSDSPNSTNAVLRNIVVSTSEPLASEYIEGTVLLIIE